MKWLHNILKGVSLTAALFVFQACYGTPQTLPEADEMLLEEAADSLEVQDAEVQAEAAEEVQLEQAE